MSSPSPDAPVQLKIDGPRATLTISRPQALNALNEEVLTELKRSAIALSSRPDVEVVVLAGSGEKAFVAGADLRLMANMSPERAQEFAAVGQGVLNLIEDLPQIVIARVQGFALGGGLELALAADVIYAASTARFGLPEVGLGLIPGFGGTQRLARRIGVSRALEWTVSAEKYAADIALRDGLVNQVFSPEELDGGIDRFIQQVLRNGPHAVRAAKRAVKASLSMPRDAGLALEKALFGLCFAGREAREGVGAFLEKRPADFRGSR